MVHPNPNTHLYTYVCCICFYLFENRSQQVAIYSLYFTSTTTVYVSKCLIHVCTCPPMLKIPPIHNYTMYMYFLGRIIICVINAQDYFAGLTALIEFPERLSVHWSSAEVVWVNPLFFLCVVYMECTLHLGFRHHPPCRN